MENKLKITMNGQSFEIPVDTSLLNGLFGMDQMPRRFNVALPMPMPIETSHQRLEQSSHQRLEDNFFKLLDNETRTNRAIMALHRRLKVLEDRVMPMPKQIGLPFGLGVGPNILAEFGKVLKDLKPIVEETKPKKPIAKTKAVPKTKGKFTKKPNSK